MNDAALISDVRESAGFRSSAASHPGARRRENQDAYLNRPDLGLWAVADGAGGYHGAAAAAQAIVAALDTIAAGINGVELLAEVRLRLAGVHAALGREAAECSENDVMASTVVVLIVHGAHFACLWAGDSRAYRVHGGALQLLTRDHSLVQDLIEAGAIDPADADRHPRSNVITRAIGANGDVPDLDKVIGSIDPDDGFLLCTDGVWKVMDAAELGGLLVAAGSVPPSERVVAAALARDASDNVTAVVVEVGGT